MGRLGSAPIQTTPVIGQEHYVRVEVSNHQLSLRVYDDHSDLDYVASCQADLYAGHCLVYTINGKKFYSAIDLILKALWDAGARVIEGAVSEAHFRLLRISLRRTEWEVENAGACVIDSHPLIWIRCTRTRHLKK